MFVLIRDLELNVDGAYDPDSSSSDDECDTKVLPVAVKNENDNLSEEEEEDEIAEEEEDFVMGSSFVDVRLEEVEENPTVDLGGCEGEASSLLPRETRTIPRWGEERMCQG